MADTPEDTQPGCIASEASEGYKKRNFGATGDVAPPASELLAPGDGPRKRPAGEDSVTTTAVVPVPREAVGFVIGKGGQSLKELMTKSGTHIEMDPNHQDEGLAKSTADFFVTGTRFQIDTARALILRKVAAVLQGRSLVAPDSDSPNVAELEISGQETVELWAPGDRIGMIIGTGGQVIRNLQERSSAAIAVHNEKVNAKGEKLVTIAGGKEEVKAALSLIDAILKKPKPVPNALSSGLLPPSHTPLQFYGSLASAPASDPRCELTRVVYVPNSCVGIIIGKGGETIRDLQLRSGAHVKVTPDKEAPVGAAERSVTIWGSPGCVDLAHCLVNDLVREGLRKNMLTAGGRADGVMDPASALAQSSASITVVLAVPDDKIGLVIGKGGSAIRELQQRSGARVVVAREGEANSPPNTRPVTVTGPKHFVEVARSLIIEKVSGIPSPHSALPTTGYSTPFVSMPLDQSRGPVMGDRNQGQGLFPSLALTHGGPSTHIQAVPFGFRAHKS
uniref:K Homology domain-containing protein n=1 Tax=Compsopogon caeruleus TaxID=31354 RepID=A0A7S1XDL3_9RHOD|mmetsp:Transcript_17969/g.37260  ORF Transcript_17969/g.37260 Transcript_17969/m.37260 type:complete len:506 (+) Transcript_17969:93-1610(+)